jgi:uncharacterized RmlC-like cupin family protein
MLRVSDVWERALHTPGIVVSTPGEIVIIRPGHGDEARPGTGLPAGVSSRSAGSRGLCLHLVMIPPGTRGVPHIHEDHESAIYAVTGEIEVWHGEDLRQRTVVKAGDFMYVPPEIPHLAVNRGDVMAVAVVARTDPKERDSVVTLDLPEHLAELDGFPIASEPHDPAAL